MAKGAITGARAGTALRGVLSKLSAQSDNTINPSMIGLGDTLKELQSRNLDLAKATKLVGEEGATGLLTLIKQIDLFEELDGSLNQTGNAMEQMLTNTDNLEGSLEDLSNAWEDFILSLSESDGILRGTVDTITILLEAFNGTEEEAKDLSAVFDSSTGVLRKLLEEYGTYGNVIIKLQGDLEKLGLRQTEFGAVVDTNVASAFSLVEVLEKWRITQEKLNGTFVETTEEEKTQAKTIGELKKELAGLRKELDKTVKFSEEYLKVTAKINQIQAILKDEVKKTLTPIEMLRKRIAGLKEELLNQELAGKISTATLGEYKKAVRQAEEAVINLDLALEDTLKTLPLMNTELNKLFIFEPSFIENTTALEDFFAKHGELIDQAIEAEQTLFRIISQLNTNRLIEIDNEESRELKALKNKGLGEEELAEKQLEIQEKADEARREILIKQAKADKIAAIFQATINTAIAVTRALITSTLLAVLVGALGAAEIAVIASQPIPEFHEGKKAELKDGEIYAKILKSESVIPPEQSKQYKGAVDAMIDKNFEKYVFDEYMLPMITNMGKGKSPEPYNDVNIWSEQRRQSKLMQEGNTLAKTMIRAMDNGSHRRTWR